jgi:hypothetical protein
MDEETGDFDRLTHLQKQLEAEATALFEVRQREGRGLSEQEYRRAFEVVEASNLIANILARHAKRQQRIAGAPPPPPRPPVIAARPRRPVRRTLPRRRIRVRRTAAPLATRTRGRRGEGARRAAPAKEGGGADPEPPGPALAPGVEGDPVPRILNRLARSAAWARLPLGEQQWIRQFLSLGLSAQSRAAVADVFAAADHSKGEHEVGPLWLGPELPVGGLLVRDHLGLWRILWITEVLDGAPTQPAEGSA